MARPLEAPVLGDVEEFRQPRILVAAQRRIDRVIGNDPRLLGVVADAAQRALGMLARFGDAQMHAIRGHPLDLQHNDLITTREAPSAFSGRKRGQRIAR